MFLSADELKALHRALDERRFLLEDEQIGYLLADNTMPLKTLATLAAEATEFDGRRAPNVSAIYFLYGEDGLLYVGQARSLRARLRGHFLDGSKPFRSYAYVEVHRHFLDHVESFYMELAAPPYNVKSAPRVLSGIVRDLLDRRLQACTA